MNDTELRAALHELAERVPLSEDPWTEHERRVAARTRSNRGWLAVSAAAACLLLAAGIAIPALLDRDGPSPNPADDLSGGTIGPMKIEGDVGDSRNYWVIVERRWYPEGVLTDSLCLLPGTHSSPSPEQIRRDGRCRSAAVADNGPAAIHPVSPHMCTKGPSCGRPGLLILAAPEVAQLEVEKNHKTATTVRELGRTDQLALFQATWDPAKGFSALPASDPRYVARDADGRLIDTIRLTDTDRTDWGVSAGPAIAPVNVVEYINGNRETYKVAVKRTRDSHGSVTDRVCETAKTAAASGRTIAVDERPCTTTPVGDDGRAKIHPVAEAFCSTGRYDVVVDCAGRTGVVAVVTAPEVARLEVAGVGGDSVRARELDRTDQVALFVADFIQTPQPREIDRDQQFVYTAYDDYGRVIDEVTLSANDVKSWR